MKTGIAEVNGTKLYYELTGEGPPLVLLSGGGCLDCRGWDDQFQAFAKDYQVIRYDVRGIGKSEMPEAPFSHVQDLYSLLNFLQIEQTFLLGLSFGGAVAIDFTLEYPKRVKALVLAAPGLSSLLDEVRQALAVLALAAREEDVSRAIQNILATPYFVSPENTAARQKVQELISANGHVFHANFPFVNLMQPPERPVMDRLSEIHVPTLILVGSLERPSVRAISDWLETHIDGARKVVIANAGRMMNLEKPEEFNRVVREFLHEQRAA